MQDPDLELRYTRFRLRRWMKTDQQSSELLLASKKRNLGVCPFVGVLARKSVEPRTNSTVYCRPAVLGGDAGDFLEALLLLLIFLHCLLLPPDPALPGAWLVEPHSARQLRAPPHEHTHGCVSRLRSQGGKERGRQ